MPIYLLDWLGMGRSSRDFPFKITAKPTDTPERVRQAEAFFLDSLEEWREGMGINKMTLVGHSLGAYLVTAYALKYPQHVNRLVLLSPAGVNAGPDTVVPDAEFERQRSNPDTADTNGRLIEVQNPSKSKGVAAIKKEQVQDRRKEPESLTRRLVSGDLFILHNRLVQSSDLC
jgi:cardiolipin-specific phospholipase